VQARKRRLAASFELPSSTLVETALATSQARIQPATTEERRSVNAAKGWSRERGKGVKRARKRWSEERRRNAQTSARAR
jgi:hypothetical protein